MMWLLRAFFVALLLIAVQPAHASDDENASPSLNLNTVEQDFNNVAQENSSKREELTKQAITYIEKIPTAIANAMGTVEAAKAEKAAEVMPFDDEIGDLSLERSRSVQLAKSLNEHLNNVNLQTILLYSQVQDQSLIGGINPYSNGRGAAMSSLFQTYRDLFCVPGPVGKPPGCGDARADYGIDSGETFIDFFVGEKTWPQRAVLEVMHLARAFFGGIPPKIYIENIATDPESFMVLQRQLTRANMKMAIIDYLAARRGPTSAATFGVLRSAFKNFMALGQISGLDYVTVCDRKAEDQSSAEQYICSFTNKPEKAGDPRIISQAALDRLTQYDFYMNGSFSAKLQTPQYGVAGPLDKLDVFINAQRLTQDYQQLQLLQMTTAAKAMNIMNEGNLNPGGGI